MPTCLSCCLLQGTTLSSRWTSDRVPAALLRHCPVYWSVVLFFFSPPVSFGSFAASPRSVPCPSLVLRNSAWKWRCRPPASHPGPSPGSFSSHGAGKAPAPPCSANSWVRVRPLRHLGSQFPWGHTWRRALSFPLSGTRKRDNHNTGRREGRAAASLPSNPNLCRGVWGGLHRQVLWGTLRASECEWKYDARAAECL